MGSIWSSFFPQGKAEGSGGTAAGYDPGGIALQNLANTNTNDQDIGKQPLPNAGNGSMPSSAPSTGSNGANLSSVASALKGLFSNSQNAPDSDINTTVDTSGLDKYTNGNSMNGNFGAMQQNGLPANNMGVSLEDPDIEEE